MNNLKKVHPFEIQTTDTNEGIITILQVPTRISHKDNISFENQTMIANYIDNDRSYNTVYSLINTNGEIVDNFMEEDGILPTLFLNQEGEAYVSVVPYHPDKELEISLPVFNREKIEKPKGNRPFTGEFIGIVNHFSVFFDIDIWSDTKPDKMLAIEFKNNEIKKKSNIKIPLPKNNNIYIYDNQIHLLAKENNVLLHRQIEIKGNTIESRTLPLDYCLQAVSLSFNENSYLLVEAGEGQFEMIIITPENIIERSLLYDIGDPIFNTWQPVRINEDIFVTRFNTEFGNGWLTTKKDKIIELFYSKDQKGYKNLLTGKVIGMPDENLVISGLNKTKNNAYSVIFYPMTERSVKNKKIMILNREIT